MNETCKDCGKRIYWVGDLGVWYHYSQVDMLTCPATVIEPAAPMPSMNLEQLTQAELVQLARMLYSAGHKFAKVGHALGGVALTLPVADPVRDILFDQLREPYVDAMLEAHSLADAALTGSI